jgi:hypothetical protein
MEKCFITFHSFSDYQADEGGAIVLRDSTGSIKGTTISDNMATFNCGGVFQRGTGTVTLQIAKVNGNIAPTDPDSSGKFTYA